MLFFFCRLSLSLSLSLARAFGSSRPPEAVPRVRGSRRATKAGTRSSLAWPRNGTRRDSRTGTKGRTGSRNRRVGIVVSTGTSRRPTNFRLDEASNLFETSLQPPRSSSRRFENSRQACAPLARRSCRLLALDRGRSQERPSNVRSIEVAVIRPAGIRAREYVTNARSMTSNAIRSIRRKKSSLCEVKVAVIGAPGVGKSALTVRFLTRRYIGEYDHQSENRYKHEVLVDGEPILFEILDSCPKSDEEMPSTETLQWADGLLLVYSITDRGSFNFVRKAKEALAVADPEAAMPLALVGNKADMVHLRQVSTEEGEILAKDFECWFSEVTAAEQVVQVADSFHELCREVLAARRRNKQSLLDRMLGSKATRAYSRGKSDSALPKD